MCFLFRAAGEEKKSFQPHHACLCQQFNCSLSNHRFYCRLSDTHSFLEELKVTEYLVRARSSFLKRPVSLLEPTLFKTIFKQNTPVSDKANEANSAEETMPPRNTQLRWEAEQRWSARSPPGRWMSWVTGEIRNEGGRIVLGGSNPVTVLCWCNNRGIIFAFEAFPIFHFSIWLLMWAYCLQCVSTSR